MKGIAACYQLLKMEVLMGRDDLPTLAMSQALFLIGILLGIGYFIPEIGPRAALFLITGAAAQTVVAIGLTLLPQLVANHKNAGHLEYTLTLPVPREAYLAAIVLYVAILSLPATAVAVAFGAWHYDVPLAVQPIVAGVAVLSVVAMAGVGMAMAVVSPYQQLTNMLSQFMIFYVLLFSPVLIPRENLPALLREVSVYLPPTYVADAMRGSLTDLPGTHLWRSLLVLAAFAVASTATCSLVMRRRG